MFKTLIVFLLTHFSVGLLLTTAIISLDEMGTSFFRLNTWLSLFLISLGLWVQPFGQPKIFVVLGMQAGDALFWQQLSYLCFGLTVMVLLLYNLLLPRGHKLFLWGSLALGVIGIAAYALGSTIELPAQAAQLFLVVIHALTATFVLGSVLGAMITGHSYLVQHDLSLTPIIKSSKLYLYSTVARTAVVLATLLVFWNVGQQLNPASLVSGLGFASLVFWFRVGIGLIVPLIFGVMVLSSARIQATQSATGILYATVILLIVGEVSAKFLTMTTGMPF